nr:MULTISPECIES: WYL domain-containing protein [unclassified Exiguobacterium]
MNHFVDAPLYFDQEEQNALYHAAIFAEKAGYYGSTSLQNAILKINRHSKVEETDALQLPIDALEVAHEHVPLTASAARNLSLIESAILKRFSIEITYRRPNAEKTEKRRVDPYKIVYWKSAWYVTGHCHLRNAIRNFRVNRIEQLTVTDHLFLLPESFRESDLFLTELLPSSETNESKKIDLVIRGTETAIEELSRHWYLKNCIKQQEQREIVFFIETSVLETYIPGLLITYGTAVQIVSPTDAKQLIIARLLELAEFHSQT